MCSASRRDASPSALLRVSMSLGGLSSDGSGPCPLGPLRLGARLRDVGWIGVGVPTKMLVRISLARWLPLPSGFPVLNTNLLSLDQARPSPRRRASLAGLAGWVIATQLLGLGFCGIQFYGLSVLRLRLGLGFGYALAFATPGSSGLDRYQRARTNLHFARA